MASLTVKSLMDTSKLRKIKPDDTLRTVIQIYADTKLDTIPVVDDDNKVIGVFPKGSLYKALLDGKTLDEPCAHYIVYSPVFKYADELEIHGGENSGFDQIVSKNPKINRIKNETKRIAQSSSTILLTGESGVGKDMFARAIHAASLRAEHAFVKVNCTAIPETLLESELFGYAPGSFTGALKSGKPGYFEQADQGTIFLNEIGDTPLSIQVKILQVIQEKQFMRVGGTGSQKVDVRIIAATNRDLHEAIAKGVFRKDLFYRLNVIEISLLLLRARPEDILPLAEVFIQKYNHILGARVVGISKVAQETLVQHDWPGNVRELENAIERAANYAWEGEIGLEHLPAQILRKSSENPAAFSYRAILTDLDREIILEALRKTDGNKSAAARLLKISRSAFYEKLTKYDL